MKYQPHVQALEVDGFTETRDYRILATGKAFRNLMDGLYSRKIEAVVRELATNAYDSHIEAGTPGRQFTVQLPQLFKPLFVVRDYGVGMPHEQVMERYSTLFDSTKDHSNKGVGMLGLGSKSPFAYTDGFTLICWDGEVQRTYASYLGAGGVPMISLANAVASAAPRGVEVSFAVKREDVYQFENAAIRVFKGFDTLPLGLPDSVLRKLRHVPQVYGDGWALAPSDYLPGGPVWALQGCVYYPVDLPELKLPSQTEHALKDLSKKILLNFPIGQLEFTPGRETLSYTPETVANLQTRLGVFQDEISESFERELGGCTSDYERAVVVSRNNLSGLFGGLFKLSRHYGAVRDIEAMIRDALPYDLRNIRDDDADSLAGVFTSVCSDGTTARCQYRARKSGYPTELVYDGKPIAFVERTPGTTSPWKRVSHYLQRSGIKYALCWKEHDPADPDSKYVDPAVFGNPPVLRTEDLPLPPPAPKLARPKHGWRRYRVQSVKGWRTWDYVDEAEDLPDNCVYVFEWNESIVEPDPRLPACQWPVVCPLNDMHAKIRWQKVSGGRPVAVLRLRANEVLHRWRKLPRFWARTEEQVVAALKPAEVAQMINVRNAARFNGTFYARALSAYSEQMRREGQPPGGPLAQLDRFGARMRNVPPEKQEKLSRLLEMLTWLGQERLTERGLAMGLEVLPEACERRSRFPENLLPLPWENVAHMLCNDGKYSLTKLVRQITENKP